MPSAFDARFSQQIRDKRAAREAAEAQAAQQAVEQQAAEQQTVQQALEQKAVPLASETQVGQQTSEQVVQPELESQAVQQVVEHPVSEPVDAKISTGQQASGSEFGHSEMSVGPETSDDGVHEVAGKQAESVLVESEFGRDMTLPEPEAALVTDAPAGVSPEPSSGAGPVSKKSQPTKLPASIRAEDAEKTSYVYVPKNLMKMVSAMIPGAKNRNDALAAYLFVTMNREPVVTDDIRALANEYTGDSEVTNLKAQIDELSKALGSITHTYKSMESALAEITTMLVWLVGERMNASIDLSQRPDSMDFLFQEHEFIRRQAANQTAEYIAYLSELQARARFKAAAAARDSHR